MDERPELDRGKRGRCRIRRKTQGEYLGEPHCRILGCGLGEHRDAGGARPLIHFVYEITEIAAERLHLALRKRGMR